VKGKSTETRDFVILNALRNYELDCCRRNQNQGSPYNTLICQCGMVQKASSVLLTKSAWNRPSHLAGKDFFSTHGKQALQWVVNVPTRSSTEGGSRNNTRRTPTSSPQGSARPDNLSWPGCKSTHGRRSHTIRSSSARRVMQ
jgi:hypothetical protein